MIVNNSVVILGQNHATGRCRRRFAFTLVADAFVSKVGEAKAYARVCPSSAQAVRGISKRRSAQIIPAGSAPLDR